MKIEIWSDIMCPFCYIGKRLFEEALERFPHQDKVEVIYKSFELDPHAQRDVNEDIYDILASKYGMSREKAITMNDNVRQQAQEVGLTYDFDNMVMTNTFDAHRLSHYAAKHGKMYDMIERLFKACFTDSKHVGDPHVLAELAAEVGLDKEEATRVLSGSEFAEEVRHDAEEARKMGISGVPFFVINRKYGISGAQPVSVFEEALQKAWEEENPITMLNESETKGNDATCADGVCAPSEPN